MSGWLLPAEEKHRAATAAFVEQTKLAVPHFWTGRDRELKALKDNSLNGLTLNLFSDWERDHELKEVVIVVGKHTVYLNSGNVHVPYKAVSRHSALGKAKLYLEPAKHYFKIIEAPARTPTDQNSTTALGAGGTGDDGAGAGTIGEDDAGAGGTGDDDGAGAGVIGDDGAGAGGTGNDDAGAGGTGHDDAGAGAIGDGDAGAAGTDDDAGAAGDDADGAIDADAGEEDTGDDDLVAGFIDDGAGAGGTGDDDAGAGGTGDDDSGAGAIGDSDAGAGGTGDEGAGAGAIGDGAGAGGTGDDDAGAGGTGDDDSGAGVTGDDDAAAGTIGEDDAGAGGTRDDDGAGAGVIGDDGAGAGAIGDGDAGAAGTGDGADDAGDGAAAGAPKKKKKATKLEVFASESKALEALPLAARLLFVLFRQAPVSGYGKSSVEAFTREQVCSQHTDQDKFDPELVSSVHVGLGGGRLWFGPRAGMLNSEWLKELGPFLYFNIKEQSSGLGGEFKADNQSVAEQVQVDLLAISHAMFPGFAVKFPFSTVAEFGKYQLLDMQAHIANHATEANLFDVDLVSSCCRGRSRSFAVVCFIAMVLQFARGLCFILRCNLSEMQQQVFWLQRRGIDNVWFDRFRLTCHFSLQRRGETACGASGIFADRHDR